MKEDLRREIKDLLEAYKRIERGTGITEAWRWMRRARSALEEVLRECEGDE